MTRSVAVAWQDKVALVLLVLVLGLSLFPLLSGVDPAFMDIKRTNLPIAGHPDHFLGTDSLGRDNLAWLGFGLRILLSLIVIFVVVATAIALIFGRTDLAIRSWGRLLRWSLIALLTIGALLSSIIGILYGYLNIYQAMILPALVGGFTILVSKNKPRITGIVFVASIVWVWGVGRLGIASFSPFGGSRLFFENYHPERFDIAMLNFGIYALLCLTLWFVGAAIGRRLP